MCTFDSYLELIVQSEGAHLIVIGTNSPDNTSTFDSYLELVQSTRVRLIVIWN